MQTTQAGAAAVYETMTRPLREGVKAPDAFWVEAMMKAADMHDVRLWLSQSTVTGYVELDKVVVPARLRKQGVGSAVMRALCEVADAHGWTLTLTPTTDFGATSVRRLVSFYRRFGFVPNSGPNKDFTTRRTMLRPKGGGR